MYDLIIIGSGPAGLSAAVYGKRAGLNLLIIEEKPMSGGQILNTYEVDNYLGLPGISGFDMGMTFRQHAEKLGAEFLEATVHSVEERGDYKCVYAGNQELETRTVIFATGAEHAKLGVPGEEELNGMGVSYCATCDGMLYRGKRAAVIGLAADAPAEADFLREIGCDVQYYDGKKHRFEIRGAERADTLVVDGAAQPADVIFVLRAGFAADTLLPGIATDKGHIVVDESYAASIPGVFAAGDCTGAPYQIPAAVGEGNRAALSVVRWLRNA